MPYATELALDPQAAAASTVTPGWTPMAAGLVSLGLIRFRPVETSYRLKLLREA